MGALTTDPPGGRVCARIRSVPPDDNGDQSRSSELDDTAGFKTILYMVAILALAVLFTIQTIEVRPAPAYDHHPNPSPLGYTYSLVLFAFPIAALLAWAFRRRLIGRLKAAGLTVGILFPLWCLLDILLGNAFFRFPIKSATIGFDIWGYVPGTGFVPSIPIEEFVFYYGGCVVLMLLYLWSSAEWFERYSISDETFDERARTAPPLVSVDGRALAIGLAVFVLAVGYKKFGPHEFHDGFPGYFTFLLVLVVLPAAALFRRVKGFVNGRAFLFTLLVTSLVSLLWEVTLALPYGWWNYREEQMIGIFVEPWSRLPVEACTLWIAAGWAGIFIYEAFRIYVHSGKTLWVVLFGPRADVPTGR